MSSENGVTPVTAETAAPESNLGASQKEGIRSVCYRSKWRYHHWKPHEKMTKKTPTGAVFFFNCILCQVVKIKMLTYKDLGNGKVKAVIKEVFPSGQVVDEERPEMPLSEQEEHDVKA